MRRTTFGVRPSHSVSSTQYLVTSGFTLVEMLVVVTIIGILVALLIPTIAGVTRRAQNGTVAMEVQELSRSIEAYKAKVGDYPPDFTNRLAVVNHMSKAYSRNTRNVVTQWLDVNLNTSPIPPGTPSMLDPAEALVFWLSQIRKNLRDPLGGTGESEVYFKFDQTRLKDADQDGWPEYYPRYGADSPYVYFDGRQISVPNPSAPGNLPTYAYAWAIYPTPYDNTTANHAPDVPQRVTAGIPSLGSVPSIGVVRPYRSTLPLPPLTAPTNTELQTWQDLPNGTRTQWMEPGKFQIICAGRDSHFGVDDPDPNVRFKTYPTMNYYSNNSDRTNDNSNIASFSDMKTLEDAVP